MLSLELCYIISLVQLTVYKPRLLMVKNSIIYYFKYNLNQ